MANDQKLLPSLISFVIVKIIMNLEIEEGNMIQGTVLCTIDENSKTGTENRPLYRREGLKN